MYGGLFIAGMWNYNTVNNVLIFFTIIVMLATIQDFLIDIFRVIPEIKKSPLDIDIPKLQLLATVKNTKWLVIISITICLGSIIAGHITH